ncbi:24725_t:CDS:2 [Cetraspora pellucida]|uniref:24725_t:CDS:1 n=1 Tax=Cetraspora pellucida TaxID=1433469 RepID=A0A9N9BRY1_9GLOM|nr:24725_t:CDS:2 [Cetraspora pellucida]
MKLIHSCKFQEIKFSDTVTGEVGENDGETVKLNITANKKLHDET